MNKENITDKQNAEIEEVEALNEETIKKEEQTENDANVEEEKNLFSILEELQNYITSKKQSDELMQQMYDDLYKEYKWLKDNFKFNKIHKPVIKDLIFLYDNITNRIKENDNEDVKTELLNVQIDLLSLMARMDVEPISEIIGEIPKKANLKLHKIVKSIHTENEEEDLEITKIIKTGFMINEKIFRPEYIEVKRFKKK